MSKKDKNDIEDDFEEEIAEDNFVDYDESRRKNIQNDHHKRYIREQLHLRELAREFNLSPEDLRNI